MIYYIYNIYLYVYIYNIHNIRSIKFQYHFIVNHFILVICSLPALIVYLICKKTFNKIM